jgi:hypothetical protein
MAGFRLLQPSPPQRMAGKGPAMTEKRWFIGLSGYRNWCFWRAISCPQSADRPDWTGLIGPLPVFFLTNASKLCNFNCVNRPYVWRIDSGGAVRRFSLLVWPRCMPVACAAVTPGASGRQERGFLASFHPPKDKVHLLCNLKWAKILAKGRGLV